MPTVVHEAIRRGLDCSHEAQYVGHLNSTQRSIIQQCYLIRQFHGDARNFTGGVRQQKQDLRRVDDLLHGLFELLAHNDMDAARKPEPEQVAAE